MHGRDARDVPDATVINELFYTNDLRVMAVRESLPISATSWLRHAATMSAASCALTASDLSHSTYFPLAAALMVQGIRGRDVDGLHWFALGEELGHFFDGTKAVADKVHAME